MSEYADPDVLVTTDWVAERLGRDDPRLVEVDVDTTAYEEGHIPGAIGWDWRRDLCDPVERDILSAEAMGHLLSVAGITPDTTVVLYGDHSNWFACWAFWQLEVFGHRNVRILDGGRKKWIAEGRELSRETPTPEPTEYRPGSEDRSLRAFLSQVMRDHEDPAWVLVDVRSPAEFSGEILAPPGLAETCQRGGHIPGARNIPWNANCNDDGTFKSRHELEDLYRAAGVTGERNIVTYCRIGERSSLTWFVLRHLLGYEKVQNYDGSWTEWGNLVGAPIAVGPEPLASGSDGDRESVPAD